MAARNLKYNAAGTIDMEYEHPVYGWIPFTASPSDSDEGGRALYAAALAGMLGAVAPYVKDIGLAKTQQIDKIEAAYQAANAAPISYLGSIFQADAASQQLIAAVLTASGGALPVGFVWFDIDNIPVPMAFTQLQELAGSILLRGQPLFSAKQNRKATIRAATTVAEVEAVIF